MLESQIHIERMIEKEIKMGKTKATVTLHEVSPKAPAGHPSWCAIFFPPEAQQPPRAQAHVGSVQTRDQTTN